MQKKALVYYVAVIAAGAALTKYAIGYATTVRGGPAIGGEMLVFPTILLFSIWIMEIKENRKEESDMCSVCLQNPCHPSCPNAPDPEPVYRCTECGYGIYDGEKYAEIDGKYYCEECLDDMATETLLSLCGIDMNTARENDGGVWYD